MHAWEFFVLYLSDLSTCVVFFKQISSQIEDGAFVFDGSIRKRLQRLRASQKTVIELNKGCSFARNLLMQEQLDYLWVVSNGRFMFQ